MFAVAELGGPGPRPTRGRSLWVEVAAGVWAPHPVISEAELPDPAAHRRLTDTAPGAALAAEVEHTLFDPDALNDAELVDAITGVEHLARWAAGVQTRLVAEFAHRRPGDEPTLLCTDTVVTASRWAPDELGLALEQSRFDATTRIARSLRLTHVLPDTLTALTAGTIDERRATALCDTTALLPRDKARAVEAIVLPAAPGRTLRQLRDRLRRAVHRVDPDGEYRRHHAAHTERRVTITSRDEGMAAIWLSAAAPDAEAAFAMLTRLAETLGTEDGRSLDQRRSDIGIQLWTGRLTLTDLDDVGTAVSVGAGRGVATTVDTDTAAADTAAADAAATEQTGSGAATPTAIATGPGGPGEQALVDAVAAALARRPQVHETVRKPLIQVVVGYDTLTGASDRPAELIGHGPIDAATARAVAVEGLWNRLITDELSGALLDHGRTTYRPPTPLAEFVGARDQYCRFPTCTRRVRELDHHERFSDDGHTTDDNLNGYCRTHHLLKEHQDWHVLAHPDGRLTWITPTGQRHTSRPFDYRPFTDPSPEFEDSGPDAAAGKGPADLGIERADVEPPDVEPPDVEPPDVEPPDADPADAEPPPF